LTVLAGWRLARALRADGEVALAVVAISSLTATLALDNGYGKASIEVACLASIAAVGVARAARAEGGLGTVGTAVALALLLHRSALALLPAWAVCAALALRPEVGRSAVEGGVPPARARGLGPRLALAVGLVAPVAALASV